VTEEDIRPPRPRALIDNGDFDAYWRYHLAREQETALLHPRPVQLRTHGPIRNVPAEVLNPTANPIGCFPRPVKGLRFLVRFVAMAYGHHP
jgi:hypothetical protein